MCFVIMAVLRSRSKKVLVLLAVFLTMVFMKGQLFDDQSDSNNKRNSVFGKLNRNSGGSRANYGVPEVDELIDWYLTKQHIFESRYTLLANEPYAEFLLKLDRNRPIGDGLKMDLPENGHSWQRFYREIEQYALYNPHTKDTVKELLRELATTPIAKTEERLEYSQATLIVTLSNGAQGVFKGKSFGRDYQTPPDLMYFSEFDRHNAEIAAFHLDKILGFYRAPPSVGRWINVSSEVTPGPKMLMYQSPVGNSCFLVRCRQYPSSMYGFCGEPQMLEGSLTIVLPGRLVPDRHHHHRHPWARTYNISKAPWELSEDYCEKVVKNDLRFSRGRILMDLIDLAVFDFLTGEFSKANYDCNSCLAPLKQCCLIRQSTMVKLIKLYRGPDSLSGLLRTSLNSDPVAPVLLKNHLDAVDRRLGKVLKTVSDCISNKGSWDNVVIDDEF
ncbi:unnamed protein product [Candidula unifasciata]|uniref:FAM20 C-terminal domain-containing protein n=1 Tax=Candidula unifasciata TaxID=100452 RepID=A0A8S3ZQ94_9EUPU|nr:unnamed protein product [Candidula unifasciata]